MNFDATSGAEIIAVQRNSSGNGVVLKLVGWGGRRLLAIYCTTTTSPRAAGRRSRPRPSPSHRGGLAGEHEQNVDLHRLHAQHRLELGRRDPRVRFVHPLDGRGAQREVLVVHGRPYSKDELQQDQKRRVRLCVGRPDRLVVAHESWDVQDSIKGLHGPQVAVDELVDHVSLGQVSSRGQRPRRHASRLDELGERLALLHADEGARCVLDVWLDGRKQVQELTSC